MPESVGSRPQQRQPEKCGGTYTHGSDAQHIEAAPAVLIGLLAHHSGDTLQQLIQDLQDQEWTPAEKAARIPGLRRLHQVVESLLVDAEGGVQ